MRQKENQAPESTLAPENIARLMQNLRRGSTQAAGQLIAAFYPELRRMARARMKGERTPHTWQPTIIVNELYLEMVRIKALRPGDGTKTDREAFLGLASHIMRRMLIHHARPLYRRAERAEMSDDLTLKSSDVAGVADVENLLDRLAGIDPQLRTIVEMRVFEDRPIQEIASELNCATRTVDRRWAFARKWLQQQLSTDSPESGL
jgi:RNA polymerase sigma factor (TIGR02999 family)